jgi:hypothetical protein
LVGESARARDDESKRQQLVVQVHCVDAFAFTGGWDKHYTEPDLNCPSQARNMVIEWRCDTRLAPDTKVEVFVKTHGQDTSDGYHGKSPKRVCRALDPAIKAFEFRRKRKSVQFRPTSCGAFADRTDQVRVVRRKAVCGQNCNKPPRASKVSERL